MTTLKGQREIVDVAPELLEEWLAGDRAVLIDVREDFEHATERIDGAHSHPLSSLDPSALRAAYGTQRLVFHCRTGQRAAKAAERCCADDEQGFQLAGGIEQWKASGRRTTRSGAAPRLDVMRQVQVTSGSLVLAGVLLGAFVSPWYLVLSGFVGAGLVFAGASGWCGMAKLMARMPWNRRTA
ncbi:MAG: rhodanese-like domain-containing protein [Planctomycetota bacterium]|jgi:rhodanese-related sulfurtransferase